MVSPVPESQTCIITLSFYIGAGDPNLGPSCLCSSHLTANYPAPNAETVAVPLQTLTLGFPSVSLFLCEELHEDTGASFFSLLSHPLSASSRAFEKVTKLLSILKSQKDSLNKEMLLYIFSSNELLCFAHRNLTYPPLDAPPRPPLPLL